MIFGTQGKTLGRVFALTLLAPALVACERSGNKPQAVENTARAEQASIWSDGGTGPVAGSDTLSTLASLAFVGTNLTYVGGGSAVGRFQMATQQQPIAPMSDFLSMCDLANPTQTEGLVFGMDALTVLGSQSNSGTPLCNGSLSDCDPTTDPAAGVAFDTTIARATKGPYTLHGWRDILEVLYTGTVDPNLGHSADPEVGKNCFSEVRQSIANNFGSFFENPSCAAGNTCQRIQHLFRLDDASGTNEMFVSLLGVTPAVSYVQNQVPPKAGNYAIGADPFCNSLSNNTISTTNGVNTINGTTAASDANPAFGAVWPGSNPPSAIPNDDQDFDPVRRSCLGNGSLNHPGEQVCSRATFDAVNTLVTTNPATGLSTYACGASGNGICPSTHPQTGDAETCFRGQCWAAAGSLGLVLPVIDTSANNRNDAVNGQINDQYNAIISTQACGTGALSALNLCSTTVQVSGLLVPSLNGGRALDGLCPNGDESLTAGGNCWVPADSNGNPNCVMSANDIVQLYNSADGLQGTIGAPGGSTGGGPSVAAIDGRAFNLWSYAFVGGGWNVAVDDAGRPLSGAYYRIHASASTTAVNPCGNVCEQVSAADQIGCLVSASPCSLGLGARSSTRLSDTVALKVAAIDPAPLCVQDMSYPLWRKLYLNSGSLFGTGPSLVVAQTTAESPLLGQELSGFNFVTLPEATPGGGTPYCEDLDEQTLCGAATNVNACAANASAGHLPTVSTTCGNGVVEPLEECDNGPLNGTAPAGCSTICRRNAVLPQWTQQATVTVAPLGITSAQITWTPASDPNGISEYKVYETSGGATTLLATIPGTNTEYVAQGLTPGDAYSFSVQAVDVSGAPTSLGPQSPTYTQPGPSALEVASAVDPTVTTEIPTTTAFLYEGDGGASPVQTGVDASTIVPATAAVVVGHVYNNTGAGLGGVRVIVVGHPEYGATQSDIDGRFFLAVNGGGTLRLEYDLSGYLSAQRFVNVPWQDYGIAEDVILLTPDPRATAVTLNAGNVQVVHGSTEMDDAGTRTATLIIPAGTGATMNFPDGGTEQLGTMTVRATEFTVGSNGSRAMPADLPPTSAYTYAVDLSADEAREAGATSITFTNAVPLYLESFLRNDMPVGTPVPLGYYDATLGAWVPSTELPPGASSTSCTDAGAPALGSGVVMRILGITGNPAQAVVDVTGMGPACPQDLLNYGISASELQTLASGGPAGQPLYAINQPFWRVLIPHFCPWDLNWGDAPPDDAGTPTGGSPTPLSGAGPGHCQASGSVIGCQDQTLGEDIPITGTPYTIHYASDRQRDRLAQLQIPLSGPALPGPVQSIDVDVRIAGRDFLSSFPPVPNSADVFTFDGFDVFGRLVQGQQPITVLVGNTYQPVYTNVSRFADTGHFNTSGTLITNGSAINTLTLWKGWSGTLGTWDSRPLGIGGWTVDVNHAYDPVGRVIHFGDGSDFTPAFSPPIVTTVVSQTLSRDEGIGPVTVAADGSIYYFMNSCIRRVSPDLSATTTFAGMCDTNSIVGTGFSGDGMDANAAQLSSNVSDLRFGSDGSLYIADAANNRIRRIDPSHKISTFAGTGAAGNCNAGGYSGEGVAATSAQLRCPSAIDVAADGTVYIADAENSLIRRVTPDGIIKTVAGIPGQSTTTGGAGIGEPATSVALPIVSAVRLLADGSYVFNDTSEVRRVMPDGVMQAFAGGAFGVSPPVNIGGPATSARFSGSGALDVAPDGSVYFVDGQDHTLFKVDPNGVISAIMGTGTLQGDGILAAASNALPTGIHVLPDGSLFFAENDSGPTRSEIRRVGSALPGYTGSVGGYTFPSHDGRLLYKFDANGRHHQTIDALTGAVLLQFTYDSLGRLWTIAELTDPSNPAGQITTIAHDPSGNPSFVSPFGTNLTTLGFLDGKGYLSSLTDPQNQTTQFTYTSGGLMRTMTDVRQGVHRFSYNPSNGRLSEDDDPAGGAKTLTPPVVQSIGGASPANGFSVSVSTLHDSVTQTSYQSTYQTLTTGTGTLERVNTLPNNLQSTLSYTPSGVTTTVAPDQTTTTETDTPDPRFGMLAPVASVSSTTSSQNLTQTAIEGRSVVASGDGGVGTFTETEGVTIEDGGLGVWTTMFNAAALAWTTKSPVGRVSTVTVDLAGHPVTVQSGPTGGTLIPVQLGYNSFGQLHTTDRLHDNPSNDVPNPRLQRTVSNATTSATMIKVPIASWPANVNRSRRSPTSSVKIFGRSANATTTVAPNKPWKARPSGRPTSRKSIFATFEIAP